MFKFDRCHRILAAVTPVKFECDLNNLAGAFMRSNISLMEQFKNIALVTPTPDQFGEKLLQSVICLVMGLYK